MRLRGPAALLIILASTLPGCGGCGDDAAEPDAEEPDAEVPDAEDDPAPAPVTNLTATPDDPAEVDLAWTNPTDADLAGVLVVVSSTAITFAPVDGTSYTAAQDLGGGQTVLSVAEATDATLASAIIGTRYYFSAWAVDDATQYSTAAATWGANNTLGTQTATLSISLAGVVTVTAQPANFTLSGTAVYTDAADTLDVDLTVQNDTARVVFNLKALTTAQNEGAQAGDLFPLTGGQPSTYYGPEALDVGASAARTLALTGITGATDPITVSLSFVDAPMYFTASGYSDILLGADTSGSGGGVDTVGSGAARQGAISANGRFLYLGSKNQPSVTTIDLTTLTPTAGATLGDDASGIGGIGGLVLSADGTRLFVLLNDGAHWHGTNGSGDPGARAAATEVQLVELDPADMTETQRVTLFMADASLRTGRELQLSQDGTRAAVVVSYSGGQPDPDLETPINELWLVDLGTFTPIDTDAATAGTQPVTLSVPGWAHHAAWVGTSVYVGFNNVDRVGGTGAPAGIDLVDTTTFAVTPIAGPAGAGSSASPFAVHGTTVYYASQNGSTAPTAGLHTLDGTTATAITTIPAARGIVFDPSGTRYYVPTGASSVVVVDATTNTELDTDGDAGNGITPLGMNAWAHLNVVTPF